MKSALFTIFMRTPLHVGAGNSVGAIDSPVMRERHTRIPIIPGSSIKGVLRDLWDDEKECCEIFGQTDKAGNLLVGEGRLLAFPLRSARGAFAWITCPLVLERFCRERGIDLTIPAVEEMQCVAGKEVVFDGNNVVLEEYCFSNQPNVEFYGKLYNELKVLSKDEVWKLAENRLVLLSDEMFCYFAENACEVVTRIRINDKTGVVDNGALFNQEQVPSESLFYAVISDRTSDGLGDKLKEKLQENHNQLQFGGDETIGLGFCTTTLL